MTERPAPVLNDDYYLVNFHTIASFVVSTYHDLLTHDEQQWFEKIRTVSKPAQRLYIRLLTRRGSSFRIAKLCYPEIERIGTAADELSAVALAEREAPQDDKLLLSCFTKPELIERLELQHLRKLSRVELIAHIESSTPAQLAQYRKHLQSEQWITLVGHAHWMLMQLCFFGNLYQDSSELVLRQLGTLTYEDYPLDATARAFTSRDQIDAHWRYFECETLYDCADKSNARTLLTLAYSVPTVDSGDTTLCRRLDRIRNRIARQLERLGSIEEAERLYELSEHPPARERRVRIKLARQQWQTASLLAKEMIQTPYDEAEKLTARKLLLKCQKAQGLPAASTRLFKPAATKLVLRSDGSRVEELARRFYTRKGVCFHTENTLVNGVLGLFIWDIIFHPVPGVFFNPYQIAPADFNEPEFQTRRAELLKQRFEELTDPISFGPRIHQNYAQHVGKMNPLVRWQRLSPEMLALAIDRIGLNHWRALFERILLDKRENRSGLPDLVLFPDDGGYEFIEIKGPGDTLQANQRRWMQYFDQHSIACRLVHVRYTSK